MVWSFPIARIFGTQLRVHLTFFLLVGGFAVWGYRVAGPMGAGFAALFVLALFACVVLHEFGHAFAGRYFGIRTPDITLLPIGGLARLERMPTNPWQEFVIAIAGPAVNVVIAMVIGLLLWIAPQLGEMPDEFPPLSLPQFVIFLLSANISLVIFNMIPAFPMDGGRVLRSILASIMPHAKATTIAAGLGQIVAVAAGIWAFTSQEPRYIPLFFISIFIFLSAGREASAARLRASIEGIHVASAMLRKFRSMTPDTTFAEAAEALITESQSDFPILDARGVFIGMLGRSAIISGIRKHGLDAPISLVMQPATRPVLADVEVENALELLNASGGPFLPVVAEPGGPLVGLFTSHTLGETLLVKSVLPKGTA